MSFKVNALLILCSMFSGHAKADACLTNDSEHILSLVASRGYIVKVMDCSYYDRRDRRVVRLYRHRQLKKLTRRLAFNDGKLNKPYFIYLSGVKDIKIIPRR